MTDDDMKIDSPIEEAKDRLTALEQRLFTLEIRMEALVGQLCDQIVSLANSLRIHMNAGYHG
jgi:hypothetical protein